MKILHVPTSSKATDNLEFLRTYFFFISETAEKTYTLSDAVEEIGMGKFQILLILMAGFVNVSFPASHYFAIDCVLFI